MGAAIVTWRGDMALAIHFTIADNPTGISRWTTCSNTVKIMPGLTYR